MDDDLAGWWFLILLPKCLRYTSKKSAFDWNTTLSKSPFLLRDSVNEEKFSDFDDFSKTS